MTIINLDWISIAGIVSSIIILTIIVNKFLNLPYR